MRHLYSHREIRPEIQQALNHLNAVPVDITPRFVTAEELTRGEF